MYRVRGREGGEEDGMDGWYAREERKGGAG